METIPLVRYQPRTSQRRVANTRDTDIIRSYVSPPHSTAHSGIGNVRNRYKKTRDHVADLLSNVTSYTLHREYHRPRVRNPFYIYYLRQQVQVDLIDMRGLASTNDRFAWLVCCIDCFSRYLWVRAIRHKTGDEVVAAVRDIIEEMGDKKPFSILCDRGKEFVNSTFRNYLWRQRIKMIHPNGEGKAALVERANAVLQGLIYRDRTAQNSKRYIDRMQVIVSSYNRHPCRSIAGLSPIEAELPENAVKVCGALRERYYAIEKRYARQNKNPRFKIGDVVRYKINYGKAFNRGYHEQFSREQCTVIGINRRMAVPMFTLAGADGVPLIGNFYAEELQRYSTDLSQNFQVEKVMEKEGDFIRVRWRGYGPGFDSWIKDDGSRVPQQNNN